MSVLLRPMPCKCRYWVCIPLHLPSGEVVYHKDIVNAPTDVGGEVNYGRWHPEEVDLHHGGDSGVFGLHPLLK